MIELYFIVLFKRGEFCYAEAGPFISWELANDALDTLDVKPITGACYRKVVKCSLPFEETP